MSIFTGAGVALVTPFKEDLVKDAEVIYRKRSISGTFSVL